MNSNKPYLVGITGGSASGKTKFLQELGKLFSVNELCVLSQDNYYFPAEKHAKDKNGHINFDRPECIDLDLFKSDIEKLCNGEEVKIREYRFQHEEQEGEWLVFRPAPIIIAEGLFLLFREDFQQLFNLKLFVEADQEIQFQRRLKRDVSERNILPEEVYYQWENHVKPAYGTYLLPYRSKADIIINNNEHFENSLKVVEDHFYRILNFS